VHFHAQPHHRYPVLYLFHGTSGRGSDLIRLGDAARIERPYRLITVMPDVGFGGDGGGLFTNWVDRHTSMGRSQWERYEVHELIPWIDTNLPAVAARRGRAAAGMSQGGYGAAALAARHPDRFTEMASFSGTPEMWRDIDIRTVGIGLVDAILVGLDNVGPDSAFGDPITDSIDWQGHDPALMLGNFRGMGLWLSTGNGLPGKRDNPTDPGTTAGGAAIEAGSHIDTVAFHQHLLDAHIPHHYDFYGNGTHIWPYWRRDLRKFMPAMMRRFAHPTGPSRIQYRSIRPRWAQWGWSAHLHRGPPLQFSRLFDATAAGFRFTGSGTAIVRTARLYSPSATYAVSTAARPPTLTRASRSGRLVVRVPLGRSVRTVHVQVTERR
jgi:S-formylglutathione hydrolase FrmB